MASTRLLLFVALLALPWTSNALYTEIGGGVLVAGGAALCPYILPIIGFTSAGITAGSTAASIMSFVYTNGVGMGVLSAAQSVGALGAIGSGTVAASGAVTAGAIRLVRGFVRSRL